MIGQADKKLNLSGQQGGAKNGLRQSATAPSGRKSKYKNSAGVTVPIIDLDAQTREMLADWIERAQNFRCLGVQSDGESALAALRAEKPAVVLMDISLPGMNAIECVRLIKTLWPEIQLAILTVSGDTGHIFNALAAGASGCLLLKSPPQPELLASPQRVYEGDSTLNGDIARKVVQSVQLPTINKKYPGVLSPREREVLALLARGFTYREIAELLQISVVTVNSYIRRVYGKLHVRSRGKAVAVYMQSFYNDKSGQEKKGR